MFFYPLNLRVGRNWLCLVATFAISSCTDTEPEIGAYATPSVTRANYQSIAVIPNMTRTILSAHYTQALGEPALTESQVDWDVTGAAGELARSALVGSGANAVVTSRIDSAAANNADIILVLKQAPLSKVSSVYDPGSAFVFGGMAAVVGVAANREQRYRERMVLSLMDPSKPEALGKSICAVGVKGALVKPGTNQIAAEARAINRFRRIDEPLEGATYAALSGPDRKEVRTACQQALRNAVVQTMIDLNVMQ